MLARKERKKHQAQSRVWQFPWGTRQTLWQLLVTALICQEDNFALRDGDGARKPAKITVFLWHRCFLTSTCLSFAVDLQSVVWKIPSCVGASHVPRSRWLRAFSLLALITSLQNTDLMQNHGRGDCGCFIKMLRQVSIPSALPGGWASFSFLLLSCISCLSLHQVLRSQLWEAVKGNGRPWAILEMRSAGRAGRAGRAGVSWFHHPEPGHFNARAAKPIHWARKLHFSSCWRLGSVNLSDCNSVHVVW